MKPVTTVSDLIIPPDLVAQLQAEAEQEHRKPDELVREAIQTYITHKHASASTLAKRTPAEAAARMRERRAGTFLPVGETIKSMTEYGRA